MKTKIFEPVNADGFVVGGAVVIVIAFIALMFAPTVDVQQAGLIVGVFGTVCIAVGWVERLNAKFRKKEA